MASTPPLGQQPDLSAMEPTCLQRSQCALHSSQEAPRFWKADIDKAYRRVPVSPADPWMLTVAFLYGGEVWTSTRFTMSFGLVASAHA